MKIDRRSFLSLIVGGAAGTALSPLPWKMMDDSAVLTGGQVIYEEVGLKLENTEDVKFVLVSYLPVPHHIGEMKTKPTQMASRLLNETGIQADFILGRSEFPLDGPRKKKLSVFFPMINWCWNWSRHINYPALILTLFLPYKQASFSLQPNPDFGG